MKRIYLNRCFTTTFKLIDQLQDNKEKEKFEIVISHSMPNQYLENRSVHYEIEPKCDGQEYVNYVLSNIKKLNPNYFLPRFNVTTLVDNREKFEKLGIKTMFVTSPETYKLIDDKVALYKDLESTNILPIPETYVVHSEADFSEAYEKIRQNGWKACYKPIQGIGGEGFKRIVEGITMKEELFLPSNTQISLERVKETLRRVGDVNPFMLSGFMEGNEYSIDCLALNGELLLAVPRCKKDNYSQIIEFKSELIDIATKVTKHYGLSYLFNIQVKYHNGQPYLIEMNTRTSGGLYKSNATGANMLYQAIRLLEGKEPTVTMKDLKWDIEAFDHLTFGVRSICK